MVSLLSSTNNFSFYKTLSEIISAVFSAKYLPDAGKSTHSLCYSNYSHALDLLLKEFTSI
jgi:hypothetical protein